MLAVPFGNRLMEALAKLSDYNIFFDISGYGLSPHPTTCRGCPDQTSGEAMPIQGSHMGLPLRLHAVGAAPPATSKIRSATADLRRGGAGLRRGRPPCLATIVPLLNCLSRRRWYTRGMRATGAVVCVLHVRRPEAGKSGRARRGVSGPLHLQPAPAGRNSLPRLGVFARE